MFPKNLKTIANSKPLDASRNNFYQNNGLWMSKNDIKQKSATLVLYD